MKYSEFLEAAEKLLFSPDFKELEAKLEFPEPNIWHILGISRKEALVTRFLVWLLDPQSQHSFGARFLKSFVTETLKTDKGRQSALSPVEIAVMDLSTAEVRTEYWLGRRRCDIVVTSDQNGFLCLIENKIGARESQDQTKDYYAQSFEAFHREDYPKRICIFLSPDGTPPESEHFIPLPYQAMLDSVKSVLADRQIAETEMFLLRQFQESLRRSIAMDKETLDLVQAIYETYGSIIDFICENAERPGSDATDSVWDGKSWFLNIGDVGPTPYSWEDCRQHSFVCAGGARRYRNIMQNFREGDIIYAYASGSGYVGVGTVTKTSVPFRNATLSDGKKLTDLELAGTYNDSDDDDVCDWIVWVKWEKQVVKSEAVRLSPGQVRDFL